ncbi:hypothetical protein Q0Z83_082460 [Actinoplanes sichuanensis]|nr:hypothetical protein Q0Z83_082460 [Actinoplanes sichuanensis]
MLLLPDALPDSSRPTPVEHVSATSQSRVFDQVESVEKADCKSVAKATEVRILYPPQALITAPVAAETLPGAVLVCDLGVRQNPVVSGPAGRPEEKVLRSVVARGWGL